MSRRWLEAFTRQPELGHRELYAAKRQIAEMSTADIGKLLSLVVPGIQLGRAGPESLVLRDLLANELNIRERTP